MASEEEDREGAIVYKMKVVQFLDRPVPIILQNDNGPCPLLAISNVLLLRNNVTLSIDMAEISQRELMSLVAEWLLDANSNIQNKDDEFVKNQQQNIGDAIQLLPRLATGIDVNVRFRHIHDFEYTPECAIFDLFHVGLVHGWLCDPQDEVTFKVIGSNSYNTLVEKLVALHAIKADQAAAIEDQQPVDFAAATIAALGVPTPHMKIVSDEEFEAMNQEAAEQGKARRKGDEEEAAELLQALQLSQTDNEVILSTPSSSGDVLTSFPSIEESGEPVVDDGIPHAELTPAVHVHKDDAIPHVELTSTVRVDKDGAQTVVIENEAVTMQSPDESSPSAVEGGGGPGVVVTSIVHIKRDSSPPGTPEEVLEQDFVFTAPEAAKEESSKRISDESELPSLRMWLKPAAAATAGVAAAGEDTSGKISLGAIAEGSGSGRSSSGGQEESLAIRKSDSASDTMGNEDGSGSIFAVGEEVKATADPHLDFDSRDVEDRNLSTSGNVGSSSFEHVPSKDDKLSIGTGSGHLSEEVEDCASSVLDDDEPLYEGEQRLVDSGHMRVADKEPLYEGEGVSAEVPAEGQVSGQEDRERQENQDLADESRSIAMTEGLIIENFLSSTASQLTYHGLFSLQDGLKNNELYVFFRNNHFSTLFKYNGQIYLLATDQGYLAQPELVWEKLTEVDGDTVFATGTFNQFQVEQSSGTWNERDAVAATTDFLSSQQVPGSSTEGGANYNSDLQLAMALQQQELHQQKEEQRMQREQQARSQPSAPRPSQPSATISAGRLVTGPQRNTVPAPKPEKAKEKCTIM